MPNVHRQLQASQCGLSSLSSMCVWQVSATAGGRQAQALQLCRVRRRSARLHGHQFCIPPGSILPQSSQHKLHMWHHQLMQLLLGSVIWRAAETQTETRDAAGSENVAGTCRSRRFGRCCCASSSLRWWIPSLSQTWTAWWWAPSPAGFDSGGGRRPSADGVAFESILLLCVGVWEVSCRLCVLLL